MRKLIPLFLFILLSACKPLELPTTEPVHPPKAALGWIYNRQTDGKEMVYVPGGTFYMGREENYPSAAGKEAPLHKVTLSNFWIDKTPVTNTEYELCALTGKCSRPRKLSSWHRESYYENDAFADYPVVYVNWNDAENYCRWAGAVIPTEAQWEYAARGSRSYVYPWGNSAPKDSYANWGQPGGDTSSVNSHPDGASWVGALEMSGNVWEWTADWYAVYTADYQVDPTGPDRGRHKVTRGGSFLNGVEGIRASSRNALEPDYDDMPFTGFRCAAEAAE